MKMKITIGLLEKLMALMEGKFLPSSSFPSTLLNALKEENCIVFRTQGSRKSVRAVNGDMIAFFARQRLGINDIRAYREALVENVNTRSGWAELTGDSKAKPARGWKGFPLAVLEPITVVYNDKPLLLTPNKGVSLIIHEYTRLSIPEDIVVVGIENGENFMMLEQQRLFFEKYTDVHKTLFVSRYPQNGDIARWLADKPNSYLHFGDLDIGGVALYQNEFYKKLGNKASFLIPDDYEARVKMGNPHRYDIQFNKYGILKPMDPNVKPLLDCIYLHHKGYDQEGFIRNPFIET